MEKLIKKYTKQKNKAKRWINEAGNDATMISNTAKLEILEEILKDLKKLK